MFSIPELSNDVIFQNYFEQLLLKTPRSNQLYFWVLLSLAWNIILKSVTEFVFSKTSGLYEKLEQMNL